MILWVHFHLVKNHLFVFFCLIFYFVFEKGVSELIKEKSAEGWFRLLTQEEGDFYAVPVPDENISKWKQPITVC